MTVDGVNMGTYESPKAVLCLIEKMGKSEKGLANKLWEILKPPKK